MNAGVGYNYYSIMHYDGYAFSSNGGQTIVPKDPNVKLPNPAFQTSMHDYDAYEINYIYGCLG